MYVEKSKNEIISGRNQVQMVSLDELVPEDHLVKKVERAISFDFIHELTKEYYSPDNGRPCLDTVILFKIVLLNFLFGINSIRKTLEEVKVNVAYRWFLGLSLTDTVPNFSTFSQNYRRRYYDTDVFGQIFNKIIEILMNLKLIDPRILFIDGTHIKANANKNKYYKKQIKVAADKYQRVIQKEIDEFRELNGRDRYFDDDQNNDGMSVTIDDKTGEIIEEENEDTKTVTCSITDPDCGMFVKGEHERRFAYVDQTACDIYGWILAFDVNPGNMHDSKAFPSFFYEKLLPYNPELICGDTAYGTAINAFFTLQENIKLLTPYAAPKGKRIEFGKKEFTYIDDIDEYLCPNKKSLIPWNIDKNGNILYKIHKSECGNCPYVKECLKGQAFKTITRSIFEDCKLKLRDIRLSPEGKQIYPLRRMTIERVFAECKERHGLRYTRFKGAKKNRDLRSLLYACANIKKLANLMAKKEKRMPQMA